MLGIIRTSPHDLVGIYETPWSLGLSFSDATSVYHAGERGAILATEDRLLLEKARDAALSLDGWLGGDKY